MKRALYGFLSLGFGLVAQSCVEDTSAVYATGVLRPDDECVYTPEAESVVFPNFDPSAPYGYSAVIRVESQLVSRQTAIAADPMGVHITDADVTLRGIDGSPLGIGAPNPFRVPANGYIEASDDGTPSLGFVSVVVVPPSIAASLASAPGGVVVVEVVLIGHTTGTLDIETEPFSFSIGIVDLCGAPVSNCHPGQDSGGWCI